MDLMNPEITLCTDPMADPMAVTADAVATGLEVECMPC
jgi:hypothetical protein